MRVETVCSSGGDYGMEYRRHRVEGGHNGDIPAWIETVSRNASERQLLRGKKMSGPTQAMN
jgi:hypothetical protein